MKRVVCVLSLLILLVAAVQTQAQDIKGHWYGIGMLQTSHTYQNYLSELTLKQKGNTISGSFQYYFKDSLVKVPVSGIFNAATRKLQLKPFKMIYYLSPTAQNSIDCYMSGYFDLLVSKTESVLNGLLMSDADHKYTVPNISLRLKRSNDTAEWVRPAEDHITTDTLATVTVSSTTPAVTGTVVAPAAITIEEALSAEALAKREKVYAREIEVTESRLRLEIYDNGQIDYDSVSLFLNGKIVLKKSKLDHRAIRLTIELDRSLPFNELSMVAENLGMIPPNTAALILTDGKTRHELQLSSDLSRTATLKLVTKKE